ncbi:2-amino-4-hydroxy-6-hydroxymethyldihydropteridine diphosphokinase [Paenibacillus sp. CAU 1782]
MRTSEAEAYIALGSNIGDREGQLLSALDSIDGHSGISLARLSGIYETDPVGYSDQPAFLNMVIAVRTTLEPLELLRELLKLELELGRTREIRFGPRTIDLDLLLYEDVAMDLEELTLPHPRMMERAFVLVPLNDVLNRLHPLAEQTGKASQEALQQGKEGIALWKNIQSTTISLRSASERSGS